MSPHPFEPPDSPNRPASAPASDAAGGATPAASAAALARPVVLSGISSPIGHVLDPLARRADHDGLEGWDAFRLLVRQKYLMANHALATVRDHLWFHFGVGLGLVFTLIGGGTAFFYSLFRFLMNQPVFGPPLMDRLVGLVFLAFFSMLTFSNLIITLSTTYISRETEFLMRLPLSFRSIFLMKVFESVLYSSWAFAILSFPLFVAYGLTRQVEWFFYPLSFLLVVPYLLIPAAVGSLATMVVAAYLPARKTRSLSIALAVVSIGLTVLMSRAMGFGRLLASAEADDFLQVMGVLNVGSIPMLPSFWMGRGLQAIGPAVSGDYQFGEYFYWLAMLTSTALFLLQLCSWTAPRLYYRGWCLARESAVDSDAAPSRYSPFVLLDHVLDRCFPPQVRALLSKDFKTFWRDPAQWTQLIILFGLLVIYLVNLRSASGYSRTFEILLDRWRAIISFFNLGATCFILSILTTRFVYPLLSLEGKQFWIIGLAPIHRSRIVWQKYALCLACSLVLTLIIITLSNYVLDVSTQMRWISTATIILMAFGLTGLSVGLGALTPNFKEDNPARIANGLGGTLNVILSLLYIGVTIAFLVLPVYLRAGGFVERFALWQRWSIPYIALGILFQVVVLVVPMLLGLRKWDRMQFS